MSVLAGGNSGGKEALQQLGRSAVYGSLHAEFLLEGLTGETRINQSFHHPINQLVTGSTTEPADALS